MRNEASTSTHSHETCGLSDAIVEGSRPQKEVETKDMLDKITFSDSGNLAESQFFKTNSEEIVTHATPYTIGDPDQLPTLIIGNQKALGCL